MLQSIKAFFDKHLAVNEPDSDDAHKLQLASAALLVEMLYADGEVSAEEDAALFQLLQGQHQLSEEETRDLLALAHRKKHEATDYFQFTSLLNRHYSQQEKIRLVKNLWRLAYADNQLDKFEEHLIRRLADLLHVPHADFIRTKLDVQQTHSH